SRNAPATTIAVADTISRAAVSPRTTEHVRRPATRSPATSDRSLASPPTAIQADMAAAWTTSLGLALPPAAMSPATKVGMPAATTPNGQDSGQRLSGTGPVE